MNKNKIIIIEGIHLDPEFNKRMIINYGNKCIVFIICSKKSETTEPAESGKNPPTSPKTA